MTQCICPLCKEYHEAHVGPDRALAPSLLSTNLTFMGKVTGNPGKQNTKTVIKPELKEIIWTNLSRQLKSLF